MHNSSATRGTLGTLRTNTNCTQQSGTVYTVTPKKLFPKFSSREGTTILQPTGLSCAKDRYSSPLVSTITLSRPAACSPALLSADARSRVRVSGSGR